MTSEIRRFGINKCSIIDAFEKQETNKRIKIVSNCAFYKLPDERYLSVEPEDVFFILLWLWLLMSGWNYELQKDLWRLSSRREETLFWFWLLMTGIIICILDLRRSYICLYWKIFCRGTFSFFKSQVLPKLVKLCSFAL